MLDLKILELKVEKKNIRIQNIIFTNYRQSTHPHQIHFELLSETGFSWIFIIFYFFYLFLKRSINIQLKNKNLYHLSGILFILITFSVQLIPSGSFFTIY